GPCRHPFPLLRRKGQRRGPNAVGVKLPCRDSNPGHRPMACPHTDKVERGCLTLTLPPARTVDTVRETCRLSSRLQGVGRPVWPPGHALARNWRRPVFACHPHVYQGGTCPSKQHVAHVHSLLGLRIFSRMPGSRCRARGRTPARVLRQVAIGTAPFSPRGPCP